MEAGGLWDRLMGDFPPHDAPLGHHGPDEGGKRNLALVAAYDGGGFAGWQVQPRGKTLQGELEERLSRLCNEPVRLFASGRTDAGVHAWGQVASFSTSSSLSVERMLRGLRALAPEGVFIRALGEAPPGFHARYGARAKTYEYYIWPQAKAPLFLRNRLWALKGGLDHRAMGQALALVVGESDMAAFASQGSEVNGSTMRQVLGAGLDADQGAPWRLWITATGFLRHVVRNLTGSVVQVGQGRIPAQAVGEMLAQGRRIYPGPKAPACGLYLSRVFYTGTPAV